MQHSHPPLNGVQTSAPLHQRLTPGTAGSSAGEPPSTGPASPTHSTVKSREPDGLSARAASTMPPSAGGDGQGPPNVHCPCAQHGPPLKAVQPHSAGAIAPEPSGVAAVACSYCVAEFRLMVPPPHMHSLTHQFGSYCTATQSESTVHEVS